MSMKNAPGLTVMELAELAGKARSTILNWRDKYNLFNATPETQDNPDRWGKRYDLHAAQTVLTIQKLQEKGVTFQRIRKAVDRLREYGEDLAGSVLYSDGEGVYKIDNKNEVAEQLAENPGQLEHFATLIDLENVEQKAVSYFQEHTEQQDVEKNEPERDVRQTA